MSGGEGREIDLWYGIGCGESFRIKAKIHMEFTSEYFKNRVIVEVIDRSWNRYCGHDAQEPWMISCCGKLGEDHRVKNDDYRWSEKGYVPEICVIHDNDYAYPRIKQR